MNDEQLVHNYLKYKRESDLEELAKRYLPQIYGYVRNYTGNQDIASDISQEVFVKVWKNLKKFDQSKSFKTWIFTIAKRTAIDWMKKKQELPLDEKLEIVDESPSLLDILAQKQLAGNLALAIAQLPSHYGSVINLRIREELSFREIAASFCEPINTVKSRYRRGIALLKKLV